MASQIERRVRRGIALLDTKCPDWRKCVNVLDLDMSSSVYGLLEQMFSSSSDGSHKFYTFYRACENLGIKSSEAGNYGFDILTDACMDRAQWQALTEAWKHALEAVVTQA